MKQKLLFLFTLSLLLAASALAQTKQVTGKVIDAVSNSPLGDVSIIIPGSTIGTTTNHDGQFSLQVPVSTKRLQASFINYQTQPVDINGNGPISISLVTQARDLEQVVVVGYGTQKKKDLTGAVATIGAKDVGGRQTLQISEALSGSIAGVSVTRGNASPGAGSTILIRGITTIGTNSPLVIVDGVPVSSIDNVNPNDVESLSVLKDAASAAIYGSRGAAGVILITTKRAKSGQSSLEYNYEYGVQHPTALPKYVDAPTYMSLFNEQAINDGGGLAYPQAWIDGFEDSMRLNPDKFPFSNTDWQKTIMTNKYAPRQRHDLVFTIGTGKIKTKASLGYSKVGSFYDNREYERYLFRVNNDLQVNDKTSVNLDVFYKRTNNLGNAGELSNSYNPIYEARVMPPIYDDFYSNGELSEAKDGRNPIAQIRKGGFQRTLANQIGGRMLFNYKPVKGLSLTALVAPTFDFDKGKNYSQKIIFTEADGSPSNSTNRAQTILVENRTENFTINGQLFTSYVKEIKDHTIDVLAGFEENYSSSESLGANRTGFPLLDFPYLNSGSIELMTNSGGAFEYGLQSLFGRLQYNFRSKYFIQGNLRSDRSSRFAKNYRKAIFPSVSAGWAISEESFMKNINWLSFLKLRGSWGKAGNERLVDPGGNPVYYPYQANLEFSSALFYQGGNVVSQPGAGQPVYAVEDISWETSRTTDIGLDAAFLNNRLSLTADYYQRKTFDILLPLDIPMYLGFDRPNQNAGELNVKGWEVELGWKDRVGKLNYSVAANLSDAKSTIGDLKGTEQRGDQIRRTGSEYNEWFGYISEGLFQEAPKPGEPVVNSNTKAGDVRYVDINKDGVINDNDKVLLGGSMPRYLYGGNIRMDYQGFDFGIAFQGVGKKLSRLPGEVVQPFAEAFGNVPQEMVGRYWSKNNTAAQNLEATYPRLSRTSNGSNYALSDFWLMSGSYFRLKNLTLGYTLKNDMMKKAGIQSLRFYAAANDLFSASKFPNYLDPESADYAYPIVTTIMAGATIKF